MDTGQLCITHCIHNSEYMRKVFPYLKEEYFETSGQKELFKIIKTHIAEYNVAPSLEAIAILIQDTPMAEKLFDDVVATMTMIQNSYDSQTQTEWLVDHTEEWVKEREIFNALNECVSIAAGNCKDKTKHHIPEIMMNALSVSFDSYLGMDYFDEDQSEEQFRWMHDAQTKIPFCIQILNQVTKGGILPKTLNIVMAGINVGKTTFLIDRAAEWLEAGKNVVYFTLEVAENVIRERMDVRTMGVDFDKLHSLDMTRYKNRLNKLQEKTDGHLTIKEYPAGMAHVGHFRHFLNELWIKKRIKPDLIVIDYLGEAQSALLPPSAMSNSNLYYTSVAREFRALGTEFSCPVWTAAQFNRGGQASMSVDVTDVGDSIGIPKVADFMCAYVQPEEMLAMNQAIGIVMKNRYANRGKIRKFVIGIDNDLQKYYDVDMSAQEGVMSEEDMERVRTMKGPKPGEASDASKWSMSTTN